MLEERLGQLNSFLVKRGVRAGMEVTWFFDRVDKEN